MNITLTKHIFGDLEIPPSSLSGIYGPNPPDEAVKSDDDICSAIINPIGTQPLSESARGCNKVLIVTDDNTRSTPLNRLLPPVLDELKKAGVSENDITFLIGLGTHRAMKREEIEEKFGDDISATYKIVNHAWNDPNSLISLGESKLGFEVVINKLVRETDFLISVGSIVPHATTGFSGGGKTIIPGICGERTIEDTHWMALDYSMSEILGNLNNPIRDAINDICRTIGLKMVINTILFHNTDVYGIVAGDFELAYEKGVEICRKVYEVPIDKKVDIVIAEAYPLDIDLRQAIKAICSADIICREGGVVILPADCPEGIAPQFPEFSQYGFRCPEGLYKEVEDGKFTQKLLAYTLVAIGRIISGKLRAILVSPNIDAEQAEHMGFLWAQSLQDAIGMAFQISGKDSKVVVLKEAGKLLPVVCN